VQKLGFQNQIYLKALLSTLQRAFENSENFHKRQWLSTVRKAGFTYQDLHNIGWKFTKKTWKSAGNHIVAAYPGARVAENRGRFPLSPVIIQSITNHALSDEMSRPESNRTVKLPKGTRNPGKRVVVRYKNFSDSEAYNKWKKGQIEQKKSICSETTYRRFLN
jgi:hypothetical protein